jgi:hypothetical protein
MMTEPRTKVEELDKQSTDAPGACCNGAQENRIVVWTLLAAALVALIVVYLRRYDRSKDKAPQRAGDTAREQAAQALRITLPNPAPRPEGDGEAAIHENQEADQAAAAFVGSLESDRFHVPGCRWAQNIAATNRVTFASREAALTAGYRACQTCQP